MYPIIKYVNKIFILTVEYNRKKKPQGKI